MWQNKRQFQTGVAINDKSQGTVARHLRYCGIFNDCLLQIHCWVCLWKSFKISQHLQSYRQQIWLSRAFYVSGYLKYKEFPSDFQYDKITSILTWPLSNWCRPILSFDLPTNTIRDCDWTLMMCEEISLQSAGRFLFAAAVYSQLFCGLLGGQIYLFISKLNNAHT